MTGQKKNQKQRANENCSLLLSLHSFYSTCFLTVETPVAELPSCFFQTGKSRGQRKMSGCKHSRVFRHFAYVPSDTRRAAAIDGDKTSPLFMPGFGLLFPASPETTSGEVARLRRALLPRARKCPASLAVGAGMTLATVPGVPRNGSGVFLLYIFLFLYCPCVNPVNDALRAKCRPLGGS